MTGEKAIHNEFAAYLRKVGLPFFHSRMDRPTSQTCGDPDFAVFREGRVAFVEFKYRKGRLSPAQADRIAELARAGCAVKLARSVEEAIRYIEATLGLDASLSDPERENEALAGELRTHLDCVGIAGGKASVESFYVASSRDLGDVVIARNQEGKLAAVRVATQNDKLNYPRFTGMWA